MDTPMTALENHQSPTTRHKALFGTDEPPPEPLTISADRLSVEYAHGQVHRVCFDGVEIVRGIAFLVRDEAWRTLVPTIDEQTVDRLDGTWQICFRGSTTGTVPTRIQGRVSGDATSVQFAVEATSTQDSIANRIGFVLLHPLDGVAGQPMSVETSDGHVSHATFPRLVDPWQPATAIRSIRCEHPGGLSIESRFAGELFEMEDQRNWTDGSFKTYCRPLSLPRPYRVGAGELMRQQVTVTVLHSPPRKAASASQGTPGLGSAGPAVPTIGVGADAIADIPDAAQPFIRELRPGYLALGLSQATNATEITTACIRLVEACCPSAEVCLELFFEREVSTSWLDGVAASLVDHPPDCVTIYLRRAAAQPAEPADESQRSLIGAVQALFPSSRIGIGKYPHFVDLNRDRRVTAGAAYVSHFSSAIVHDADDRAVMQTIESVTAISETARSFSGGLPHRAGPFAIGLRSIPGQRDDYPPQAHRSVGAHDDPRWRGLFAAAWGVGIAAEAVNAGFQALSFGQLTGPHALFTSSGRPRLFPIYHVVRALASAAGATTYEPLGLPDTMKAVIWGHRGGQTTLLLANCSDSPVEVALPPRWATRINILELESFQEATVDPHFFDRLVELDRDLVTFGPYAVAKLLLA